MKFGPDLSFGTIRGSWIARWGDLRVDFVLCDETSIDPVLELHLDPPHSAGIHAVRLADHGVVLAPGGEYRRIVSLASGARAEVARLLLEGQWGAAQRAAEEAEDEIAGDGYQLDGLAVRAGDTWRERFADPGASGE